MVFHTVYNYFVYIHIIYVIIQLFVRSDEERQRYIRQIISYCSMYIVHTVQYIRETDRQKATQRLRDRQTEMDSPKRDRQTATQRLRDRQTAT